MASSNGLGQLTWAYLGVADLDLVVATWARAASQEGLGVGALPHRDQGAALACLGAQGQRSPL